MKLGVVYKHANGRDAGVVLLKKEEVPGKRWLVRFVWVNLVSQKQVILCDPINDLFTEDYMKEWRAYA